MHGFLRKAQGDVVQIRSKWGTVLVEYEYDAWGNCTIAYAHDSYGDLATMNPIRYRSYFYDFETGFYYLQSRYYDPQVRRFINADDPGMLGVSGTFLSYNLYAYCENGSSNYNDPSGYGPWTSRLYVWDYYKIHKWVQIAVKNKLDVTAAIEVFVIERDTGKKGRLDVYSFFTNSYYEVKSIGASETDSTKTR